MSKKSKNPRKGRQEQAEKPVEVETPQPTAVSAPKSKASKLKRYKDLVVAPGTQLYEALEENDQEKAKKLYDESKKQWKEDYGDFDPAEINRRIRERFQPWDGYYVKEMYDVQLKTGEVVTNCWPNAGFMMTTDGSGGQFSVDDVAGVRPALNPPY